MAVINDPNTAANVAYVAPVSTASAGYAIHTSPRPLPHGTLGHYRTCVKITLAISQAANSRLFEVRNTHATNLIIPTRVNVGLVVTGTVTTAYAAELGLFSATSFTAVDTTNTVTPTTSRMRSTMTAYPGNAAVRHCTLAVAAAGMTGGTVTLDANYMSSLMIWAATGAAASPAFVIYKDLITPDNISGHLPTYAQNEGFVITNVNVGSATANSLVALIDVSWAEVSAY